MRLIHFLFSITIAFTCSDSQQEGVFKDLRDGKTYKTTKIADREWFAQNLNYRIEGSTCFNNHPFNCRRMGRLYTWEQVLNVCPEGWRTPNDDDWNALYNHYGNSIDAYNGLTRGPFKAILSGWFTQNSDYEHAG